MPNGRYEYSSGVCSPFINTEQTIRWKDIKSSEIVTYHPMADFGGWGFRSNAQKGKAYNTKGDKGLQLVLTNGEKILLTAIEAEGAKSALESTKNDLKKEEK